MRTFDKYALGAAVFAAVATVISLGTGLIAWLMEFYVFAFTPVMLGLLISGNVHALSEFGLYAGVVVNWLLVGLLFAVMFWFARRANPDLAVVPDEFTT